MDGDPLNALLQVVEACIQSDDNNELETLDQNPVEQYSRLDDFSEAAEKKVVHERKGHKRQRPHDVAWTESPLPKNELDALDQNSVGQYSRFDEFTEAEEKKIIHERNGHKRQRPDDVVWSESPLPKTNATITNRDMGLSQSSKLKDLFRGSLSAKAESVSRKTEQDAVKQIPSNGKTNALYDERKSLSAEQVYTIPKAGLRVSKLDVPLNMFKECASLENIVQLSKLNHSSQSFNTFGVLASKLPMKTSQKGNSYVVWKLNDLMDCSVLVTLFLFDKACDNLWKSNVGKVIALLKPTVMKNRDNSNEVCLSASSPRNIVVLGSSKDFGICKSKKKNGEQCTNIVNMNSAPVCIYHLQSELKKVSNVSRKKNGSSDSLRKKVLGKNEVFYAGRSFTASKHSSTVSGKKNAPQTLSQSFSYASAPGNVPPSTMQANIKRYVVPKHQVPTGNISSTVASCDLNPGMASSNSAEIKNSNACVRTASEDTKDPVRSLQIKPQCKEVNSRDLCAMKNLVPLLGKGCAKGTDMVDLNLSRSPAHRAKMQALKYVQSHGPIDKINPNAVKKGNRRSSLNSSENRSATEKVKASAMERLLRSGSQELETSRKPNQMSNLLCQTKILTDHSRLKEIMNAVSSHARLVEEAEDQEREKYFDKLEKKEMLEEKMGMVYKVPYKATYCFQCKYTAFAPSELCFKESHRLKFVETYKRFYKCGDCGNRTVTLELIPLKTCLKCGSSRWQRTSMLKEKTGPTLENEKLSIRGDEEKFIGLSSGEKNVNLLVPE